MWTDALQHPNEYPIPRLVIFGGGSGVGKGTAVKLMAKQSGCMLFFPQPQFFANDLTRIPELFRFANDKGKEQGRHCIVFLDEVDAILSNASIAKVNTFKGTLENVTCFPNIMIVCATNHFDKLSTDVGLSSRTSNRITFNPQTPEVIQQLIEFNFSHMDKGATEVRMSGDDWNTLLPKMMGQNGHTLAAWCINVSLKVNYRHRHTDKDNFIRLEDMQLETMGLLVVALNPINDVDVSTLSDEDKKIRIKEWLKQTFVSMNTKRPNLLAIDFFGALVTRADVLPDDILLCAGVKPEDLAVVRANTTASKGLWNLHDAKTVKAREQFTKCMYQIWPSNNVLLQYLTKNQQKYLIIRHDEREGSDETKGHINHFKDGLSKVEGYFLKGLHFTPQWTPDSKHIKCIEWATLLGDAPSFSNDTAVEQLLESYPTFNRVCVTRLLNTIWCARQNGHACGLQPPELVSLGEVQTRLHFDYNHPLFRGPPKSPHVKCTFKHPSGVEVPDIWMAVSVMKDHYLQQCAHL